MWYVDLLCFLVFKKFPIGVAKYITWPETTKMRLMTSTHHLWFIPLLIIMIKNDKSFPLKNHFKSFMITILWTLCGRLLVPKTIIMPNKEEIYMNVNLSYEVWKDVPIKFLKVLDNSNILLTMGFSNFMWNFTTFLMFWVLKYFHKKVSSS